MARRLRLTPFARFILVMVIVAPLAYIAASYYNGKDGIQEFKKLIGIESTAPAPTESAPPATAPVTTPAEPEAESADPATASLQEQYNALKTENLELKKQLELAEEKLEERALEIKNLQQQLETLQANEAQ